MATVEEVEEHVRGRWFVIAAAELAKADIVNDEPLGASPLPEASLVALVGEPGVEVVDEVDAARVADADLALARAQRERLQDVALAGSTLACDEQVVAAVEKRERGEVLDERAIEILLKREVESLERLADAEPAPVDAPLDAALTHVLGGLAEDALEEDERARAVLVRPREVCVDVVIELLQSESFEVVSESLQESGISARLRLGSSPGSHGLGLGHAGGSSVARRDQLGSAS